MATGHKASQRPTRAPAKTTAGVNRTATPKAAPAAKSTPIKPAGKGPVRVLRAVKSAVKRAPAKPTARKPAQAAVTRVAEKVTTKKRAATSVAVTPPAKSPTRARARAAKTPPSRGRAQAPLAGRAPAKSPAAKAAKPLKRAESSQRAAAGRVRTAPSAPAARTTKAPVRPVRRGPLDKFLLEQQALLLAERENYVRQADTLKEEADLLAREMEPGESEFSEEGGEGGNLSVERELDLRLSAQHREAAEEIDRALAKIEAGTYGLCEKCGQPIPRQRLKALPAAPLCVACKSGGLSRR
jgi:DnaK suppressor protein